MQEADALIRTKLHVPFIRPELVPRPRLQARIREGLLRPLTLITAPAGFGKTTLVASCMAACDVRLGWLSLDRNDNQLGRFLRYLVAALQQTDHTIGREAAQILATAREARPEAILTALVNDLSIAGREMALVLDDYQFIRRAAVHDSVTFLLEHGPTTFHLVIATRSDPPLPVARLRARGQMVELRAADLGFTEPEAAHFLNEIMGLGLDPRSVALLEARTEGWIAGLQMAALALQGAHSVQDRRDLAGFIERFSGTHRYILDSLREEVLAHQPPDIQRFLLFTSILERLTAPLCDALLENWETGQLHVRASEWHARHGSILEAIHHASQAADEERVERLIEQHYKQMVSRGEMSGYRFWTGRLSPELVHRRPWLCIYEAYSHAWFGELDEADRLLEAAKKHLCSGAPAHDTDSMQAHLAYVQSRVTAMRGDLPRAIDYCLEARQYAPAGNLALEFDTLVTLGYEYFLRGDHAHAGPILKEAIRSGTAAGALIYTVAASCFLARLYAVQGRLHKSYDTYQAAAQWIAEAGEEHRDASALVNAGLAALLCEWRDLDAALAHVEEGLALLPLWGKVDDLVLADLTLARIYLAQGQGKGAVEAAAQTIEEALHLVQTNGVFPEVHTAVEVAQVKLWLAQGDLPAAERWLASREEHSGSGHGFTFENELAHIAQARVLIALNRPQEAVALLSQLEQAARSAGRMGRAIEILFLEALALEAMGNSERAMPLLADALALAEPEGYVQAFVDEGRPMRKLLAQLMARLPAQAGAGPSEDYVRRLLDHLAPSPAAEPGQATAAPAADRPASRAEPAGQALVEPLTPRELQVLALIAQGMTNKEIARHLVVAPGTVKAHAASIYRKLDVANRTEAAARARQLGILP
ncbi:MAG: LuxR C-terminal-related transcriptional regulator [Anaerolineae bacterium]